MEESIKVHTILKCFVDVNLETNEMFPYDVDILDVSLNSDFYLTEESATLNISVSLSEASPLGLEEASLILSNITTTNEDIDVSGFPVRLKWEQGEQTKVVSIPINRDFIEEADEDFMVGLTNLINLLPGRYMQARVKVEDRTVLRVVKILAANVNNTTSPRLDPNSRRFNDPDDSVITSSQSGRRGNVNTNNSDPTDVIRINNIITFTVTEGENVNITVGLDAPSEFGVEKVDLSLFSNASNEDDFSPLVTTNTQRLEWAVGEQFKTVTVAATLTNAFEGVRRMTLELMNPDSVKFDPLEAHRVQIIVLDPPVDRRYTTINFGSIYKQRGSIISGIDPNHIENEIELRRIADNQVTNTNTLYWLVEMGTSYVDNTNNPMLSESVNYALWPNYYFGVDANGFPAGVALRVTNMGVGEVQHNNTVYGPGESFLVLMARDAATVVLPTNDGFIRSGQVVVTDNMAVSADTFTEARYRFEMAVNIPQLQLSDGSGTAGPHGFQLKTTGGNPAHYLIGEFNLPSYLDVDTANANALALYSTYRNMRTRFDGSTCTNTFAGNNRVRDVRIKGLILLSQNSLSTEYMLHEFGPNDDFNPICFASAGSTGGLAWSSVPFELT